MKNGVQFGPQAIPESDEMGSIGRALPSRL